MSLPHLSTAQAILAEAQRRGIRLKVTDEGLHASPKDLVWADLELLEAMCIHVDEIAILLCLWEGRRPNEAVRAAERLIAPGACRRCGRAQRCGNCGKCRCAHRESGAYAIAPRCHEADRCREID